MLGVLPPSLRFLLPIPLLLLLLPSFFSRSANATSSEFRVDPSSPSSSTSFRSLRSAWRYLYSLPSIESNDNITIQIFPGIHRLPESQFKFNSSLNIYHVALNSSNTFIQPPRNQSRQQSAVLIQDSALLSFEGITFQRFSYSNASLEASSSFFEVIDNAKLIFENCTFSDNGVEKAGFTLSAKDNAAISFHESNLISELAHEAEIYLNGNAKLSMSSSRITGVGSWRTAVFRSFASSSIDIRDSTFTGNRNLLFSVNDFSNLNISNSEFTGNSAPPNAAVTVALVTTATVNIFRSNFSGNFGARTGALSFVGSTVSIQDTDINNNNGTAISAIRISSNSDVTLQNCSIRNHSGPKIRILQVTETAKLSIVGGTIIGNTQGWITGVYNSGSVRISGTVIAGNDFQLSQPIFQGTGTRIDIIDARIQNNTLGSGFITSDRNSNLVTAGTAFELNRVLSGALMTFYGASLVLNNTRFTSNSIQSRARTDVLVAYMGTSQNATFVAQSSIFRGNNLGGGTLLLVANSNASVSLSQLQFQSNIATCIETVDQSSIDISESEFIGNRLNIRSSGSAVYVKGNARITKSKFTNNTSVGKGAAIQYDTVSDNSTLTVLSSTFSGNKAVDGGSIFLNFIKSTQVTVYQNQFESNQADRGGAIYLSNVFAPIQLSDNIFQNNVAVYQGNDMGSPIKSLRYLNRNPSFLKQRTYVTGSALPTINIAAFDLYEQPVYTLPNETFFMGIEIYPATPLDSNPWSIIRGESAKAIISGSVSFSSLKLYGSTGPHILSFTSLTDQYDSSIYFINETINISPCDGGKIMESLPGTTISVCSDPVCTQGCLPNQGVCVQKDTCQCLDGWEGVDCGLPKEYYDGLSLILSLSGSNESGSDQAVVETAQLPELRSQIMSVLNREMEGKGDVVFRSMDVNAELSNPKRLRSVPTFSSLTSSESSKQTVITIQVLIKSEDSSTFLEGDSLAEFYPLLQSEFPSSIYLPSNQTASVSLSSLKITNSPKIYVTIADPTVIAVLLLTGICLLGTIGIMIVFTKSRQTAAVKSSSYVFCMLICLGFVLGYISIPLYTGIPTKGSCVAQIWLLALSMGMVVGNLLVKTLRIYLIFSNTKGKIMGLSDNQMLKYTASIILLELILLVLSTVIDPPVPVILNLPKLRYWTCASSNPFTHTIFISLLGAYNGSLLIMACYLAIKTRQAQSAYRESKAIGLSIYSISLLLAISFPIIYLTTTLPLFDFHARSLTIIFINIITTASLFYKKVKIILFHPELNNMEALNRKSTNHSLSLHVDPGTGGGGKSGSKNSKKMSDTAMMKQIVLSRRNSSNHDGRGSRRGSEEVQLNIHLHRKPSVGVDRSNTIGPGMLARRSSAQLGNLNHGYDRSRRGSTENGGGPMVKGSSTTVAGSYGVIKEEVEDEKGLVFEPIIELFYISVKSSKKPQWRQYYLYLFPLTEHLMMTKDPNPTTAPMIHLSLCRVRNISHIWKQCIELHTPSGKVYLIRTKHELVFTKWWTLLQRVVGTSETDAKAPNKSEQQPQNRFTPFLQLPLTRKPSILGTPGEGKLDKLNSFLPKMGKPGGVKATGIMS